MALLYAGAAWLVTPGLALLGAFYLFAALLPLRPWAWSVGLVAIAFGVPSVTIVVALPLLLAWTKPTTKAAYGRLPV